MGDQLARESFFSAPLEDEEVQRLLGIVDERLHLRQALDFPRAADAGPQDAVPLPSAPAPDHATFAEAEVIQHFPAPLFDTSKGPRLARLGKTLLNLPLRIVAAPQLYFNAVLRRILRGWADVLRSSADFQELLRIELAAQKRRLDRLASEQRQLASIVGRMRRVAPLSDGDEPRPRPAVGDLSSIELTWGAEPSCRRVRVGRNTNSTPDVVADLRALPFTSGMVTELSAVGVVELLTRDDLERGLLPHWRSLLRPGGRLRLRCTDWHEALERYRTGRLTAEQLHRLTFGHCGERRMSYTSEQLLSLLGRVGFAACTVVTRHDDAAGDPEMEILALRPSP